MSAKQKIIVLGLTGSVGESCLRVLESSPEKFSLCGFSYHNNFTLAKKIQEKFKVSYICCSNENIPQEQLAHWKKQKVEFFDNMEHLLDVDFDTVVTAVVGSIGVRPTLKAVAQGKKILLANKETLVMAGDFLMPEAKRKQASIIPVDSEHSSVFRLLFGKQENKTQNILSQENNLQHDIEKIILTASGGPFRQATAEEILSATKEQVLAHPTWDMGNKISVDSAGMINKALEIIEAHHLFNVSYENLSAVIHPQSYVHAMLQHTDGSFSFHVSYPDMVHPTAYALFYPNAAPDIYSPHLNSTEKLTQMPSLNFTEIDAKKFPAFFLGVQAGKQGGSYPAVYNAANEQAVVSFLQDKISFADIPNVIEETINKSPFTSTPVSVDELFAADSWSRDFSKQFIETVYKSS